MSSIAPPTIPTGVHGFSYGTPMQTIQSIAMYIVKNILGLDPVIVVNLGIFLAACSTVGRHFTSLFYRYIRRFCVSTVSIGDEDLLYTYLNQWMMDKHLNGRVFRSVRARTIHKSTLEEDEEAMRAVESSPAVQNNGLISYRTIISRSPVNFQPHQMRHTFWHNRRLFFFTHTQTMNSLSSRSIGRFNSVLTLECLGRSLSPIKKLLEDAQTHYIEKRMKDTTIFKPQHCTNWYPALTKPSRDIASVIMPRNFKEDLLQDMNEYLHPRTRRWYVDRGIPYRRGYLFSGPPGTGKTSLTAALAGVFGLDIYVLSLVDPMLMEDSLIRLFSTLPSRSIVLLEDVDAAGLTNRDEDKAPPPPPPPAHGTQAVDLRGRPQRNNASGRPSRLSLSGLLNAIDGVSSSEGRILIMTTNSPEDLDSALIRPGRVDRHVAFELPGLPELKEMFLRMYKKVESPRREEESGKKSAEPTKEELSDDEKELELMAEEFADQVPEGKLSLASIQGFLLMYKHDPKSAVENAEEWSAKTIKEQEEKRVAQQKRVEQEMEAEEKEEKEQNGIEAQEEDAAEAHKGTHERNGETKGPAPIENVSAEPVVNGIAHQTDNRPPATARDEPHAGSLEAVETPGQRDIRQPPLANGVPANSSSSDAGPLGKAAGGKVGGGANGSVGAPGKPVGDVGERPRPLVNGGNGVAI